MIRTCLATLLLATLLVACANDAQAVRADSQAEGTEQVAVANSTSAVAAATITDDDDKSQEAMRKAEEAAVKARDAAEKAAQAAKAAAGKEGEKEEKSEADKQVEAMQKEIQRINTENELMMARQKKAMMEMELEKARIAAEAAVREQQQNQDLAAMRAQITRLQTEMELQTQQHAKEMSQTKLDLERRGMERQVAEQDLTDELAGMLKESKRLQTETALKNDQIARARVDLEAMKQQYAGEVTELQARLQVRDVEDKAAKKVTTPIDYIDNPFQDGILYVSDRRVSLNGPIISGTAEYVTERIHYFNNQSGERPIFIVIDSCPGGSVMEGYRIVKAIKASQAPVHVVVKSFAASMAAVITTLADYSYAYPNAVILHHQMSGSMYGNLTQQEESLEKSKEWARRLAEPVAAKMGVSMEEFTRRMYEHNSNGDWDEFADQAKDLHWVNEVVTGIKEVGVRDKPEGDQWSGLSLFLFKAEKTDEYGNPYLLLPRLRPFDYYFLYNPDDYYRVARPTMRH